MKTPRLTSRAALTSACLMLPAAALAIDGPTIIISKELWYNTQTGVSTVAPLNGTPNTYSFGAEVTGFSNVTSATVKVDNGTPVSLTEDSPGNFEHWEDNLTASDMNTMAPHGATYTVRLNGTTDVVIGSPSTGSFASYLPAAPIFTISGVSGTWSTRGDGMGVFTVSNLTNFTVSRSAYSVGTGGGHFASYVQVSGGLGSAGADVQPDSASKDVHSIQFTTDAVAGDASQTDSLITLAQGSYEIEGGFMNISSYMEGASVLGETYDSGFLHANYTSFVLTVVPEPSTYGLIGAGAFVAAALARRRRKAVRPVEFA